MTTEKNLNNLILDLLASPFPSVRWLQSCIGTLILSISLRKLLNMRIRSSVGVVFSSEIKMLHFKRDLNRLFFYSLLTKYFGSFI